MTWRSHASRLAWCAAVLPGIVLVGCYESYLPGSDPFDPCGRPCGDGIECTEDRCDPAAGCEYTPVHARCDDSIACTTDLCSDALGCVSTPDDSLCAPGETCDPGCGGCILDFAPAGRFLAHSSDSLYQIDPVAPSSTYVGDIGYTVTDIAVTADSRLYGTTGSTIISIDPCTGVGTTVGPVGGSSLNALVATPDGMLFGAGYDGNVWRIDPSTGVGTLIGTYGPGLASSGDLVYGPDDRIYGTTTPASPGGNDLLVAVDPVSGAAVVVGDTGFNGVYGMAVLSSVLYGLTNSGQLITIDMTTAGGTLVGVIGSSYWGAASPPPGP